jgi:DNA-directed RNA polymerase alpha subunit
MLRKPNKETMDFSSSNWDGGSFTTTSTPRLRTGAESNQNSPRFYTDWLMERSQLPEKNAFPKTMPLPTFEKNLGLKPNDYSRAKAEFEKADVQKLDEKTGQAKRSNSTLLLLSPKGRSLKSRKEKEPAISLKSEISIQSLNKKNQRGYFPIDAFFMPVIRANYLIEAHDSLDLKANLSLPQERVILEIWTNGSLHPRQAIHKAAKSLIQLFLPLQQMRTTFFQPALTSLIFKSPEKQKKSSKSLSPEAKTAVNSSQTMEAPFADGYANSKKGQREEVWPGNLTTRQKLFSKKLKTAFDKKVKNQAGPTALYLDIGNLDLTPRCYGCLKTAKIHTLQDLVTYSKKNLLQIPNFAPRFLVEIENALQKMKLVLK